MARGNLLFRFFSFSFRSLAMAPRPADAIRADHPSVIWISFQQAERSNCNFILQVYDVWSKTWREWSGQPQQKQQGFRRELSPCGSNGTGARRLLRQRDKPGDQLSILKYCHALLWVKPADRFAEGFGV